MTSYLVLIKDLIYAKQHFKVSTKETNAFILGGLFITASVVGQNVTVTGTVMDSMGEPVIGANVIQEGTSNGSITDIDGKFSLSIPKGAVLVVSYIGYTTQNVTVTGNQPIVITLNDDTELLEEVVVVGYGTMKKVI